LILYSKDAPQKEELDKNEEEDDEEDDDIKSNLLRLPSF